MLLIYTLACALELAASPSRAEAPGTERRSNDPVVVVLDMAGAGWDPHLRHEVEADLSTELARDQIQLEPRSDAAPRATPLATITIQVTPGEIARIEIRVRDELTDKTVLRELSLGETPPEARSLEIAVAAEELLQASWAELMLTPRAAAPSPAPPPPPVAASLESRQPDPAPKKPPPTRTPRLAKSSDATVEAPRPIEHAVAGEVTTLGSLGGLVWMGGLASYELWPAPRVGVGVGVGAAGLVPAASDAGQVTGVAGLGRFELLGRAVLRPRLELDVLGSLRGSILRLRGRPDRGFVGTTSQHALGELALGLRPAVRVGPVWVFLRVEATVTPGGVDATDDRGVIASYSGLGFAGALGVRWGFTPRPAR